MEQSGRNDREEPETDVETKAIKIILNLIQDVANLRIINLIESEGGGQKICAP